MRIALRTTAIALLSTDARPRGVTDNTAVIGTWEGESKCTVPDSPCHDEHVVFRLADKNDSTVKLDAYKIVQGSPELMGTLVCWYHADQSNLSCTGNTRQPDDWQFHVSGDTMTGTLKIGDQKTLYRRITLHKTRPKESSSRLCQF